MYYCGKVADIWDSCVGDFCVYYCGKVADIWDSCVGDFCRYYSGIMTDLRNSRVDNCSVVADLSLSCMYYCGITLVCDFCGVEVGVKRLLCENKITFSHHKMTISHHTTVLMKCYFVLTK